VGWSWCLRPWSCGSRLAAHPVQALWQGCRAAEATRHRHLTGFAQPSSGAVSGTDGLLGP
jgi:hypothetical protein